MLKTRIISAIVALAAFAAVLWLASASLFALVVALLVALAGLEWAQLSGVRAAAAQSLYASAIGLGTLGLIHLELSPGASAWLLLAGLMLWVLIMATLVVQPLARPVVAVSSGWLALGMAVLLLAGWGVYALRHTVSGAGNALLLYVLCIVWCADTGAYFGGRRFGRQKLAPHISPGKTREGAWSGLVAAVGLVVVVTSVAGGPLAHGTWLSLLSGTLVAAMVSISGDLAESRLKRAAGSKDSGTLMPGHGGLLDRLDGVVAAVPVFLFFWVWLSGGLVGGSS